MKLNDEELRRELEVVKDHFRANEVTPNTVLAAYMRAHGMNPVGAVWQRAKAAMNLGHGFEAAVIAASEPGPLVAPAEIDLGRRESRSEMPPRPDRNSQTSESMSEQHDRDVASAGAMAAEAGSEPSVRSVRPRVDFAFVEGMDWFPKVFGPGDIDGDGAKRLLGTPNLPLVSVLVRETAQNSWDARLATTDVRFTLNLRQLSDDERRTLAERVFTGDSTELGLREVLSRPSIWVLEVSDRGTKGLGGPVRNDLDVPPGMTTNFIDLVFNIGAPRDVTMGGGTYGFGKTVAYQVSSCGTVLFWSRSHEADGIEDRLIGSAIGPSFSDGVHRHTGRHWWGRRRAEGQAARVEPLVGNEAADLARAVFQDDFSASETGTSLLIMDPQLGGETRQEDAQRLQEAVLWHLWPKLTGAEDDRTAMNIEVQLDGELLPFRRVEAHPVLAGYADCLQLVRATQKGTQYTPTFNTEVFEMWCLLPKKLLGHLAISRYPDAPGRSPESEVAAFEAPSSHVALMRHDAELVVKYDAKQKLDAEGLQWAAVFKPVAAVDDSFALAEPPAHDDWVPDSIQSKDVKRDVRTALTRMREQVSAFLAPAPVAEQTGGPVRSVAALADSLSQLIGGIPGSGPSTKPSKPGSPGKKKPQAEVREFVLGGVRGGRRTIAVRVGLKPNSPAKAKVTPDVGVGIEGGSDSSPDLVRPMGWTLQQPALDVADSGPELSTGEPVLDPGDEAWLLLDVEASVAVDVNLTAEVVAG